MDFTVLSEIDEQLDSEEVAALKFLCRDHVVPKKLEKVQDGRDLFARLNEEGLLEDDGFIIKELLFIIKRWDLLSKHLGTTKKQVQEQLRTRTDSADGISPYRRMLYELSEYVSEDDLGAMKFLLKITPSRKDSCTTFLDLLVEMEKQNLLADNNLVKLENLCSQRSKQLSVRLQEYIAAGGSIAQRTAPIPVETKDEVYDVSRRPRGHCLIISNYNFKQARTNGFDLLDRRGTDKDEEYLMNIFSLLHFEVHLCNDLTGRLILETVQKFGQLRHEERDVFICCVLSHGHKGTVQGTDGELVPIRDITHPFTSRQCPALARKPKLFFIQACQGNAMQKGMSVQADGEGDCTEADAERVSVDAVPNTIPDDSDFLISMATVEECKSFRSISKGSIFIQELCRQLKIGCGRNEDILTILTRVNREVSSGVYLSSKQMPEPRYTLTKKVVLPFD